MLWQLSLEYPVSYAKPSPYLRQQRCTSKFHMSVLVTKVKPLLYGHQRDRTKCPLYRGVRIIEVGNAGFLAFLGPTELFVIESCPYYRGDRKGRLDCISSFSLITKPFCRFLNVKARSPFVEELCLIGCTTVACLFVCLLIIIVIIIIVIFTYMVLF